MRIIFIFIIILLAGAGTYVAVEKPFEKREGEITLGDLMEQSKTALSGATPQALGIVAPGDYEGTLLIPVAEEELKIIRETASRVPFPVLIPSKVPKGLALFGKSSIGQEFGIGKYQMLFRSKSGDNLFIFEYRLSDYLSLIKKTLAQYVGDVTDRGRDGKQVYISKTGVITDPKYRYTQSVSVIAGSTIIRAEYMGEAKLTEKDLEELGASFTK